MAMLNEAIEESIRLTRFRTHGAIDAIQIIEILREARVRFVLSGAIGLAGWMQKPQAETEIDFLIAQKDLEKAAQSLTDLIPRTKLVKTPLRWRLVDRKDKPGVINLIRPVMEPERWVFENAKTIQIDGQTCRVPSLEMAMAMKFCSSACIYRNEEGKLLDKYDLARMVSRNVRRNEAKLGKLAARLFPGGARLIRKLINQVSQGPVV